VNLLAIETATENCSVALRFNGEITERQQIVPNGHSRLVHGMVEQLLLERKLQLTELDAIVVDIGPGSFTGLRIGIGIAQGLSFASGLSVIGVHSLAALAVPVKSSLVLSTIDARMSQVYWCLYDTSVGVTSFLSPQVSDPHTVVDSILCLEDIKASLSTEISIYGVGSGWEAYKDALPYTIREREIEVLSGQYPEAKNLLSLAGSNPSTSPMLLKAAYVRNNVAQKSVSQNRL